MFRSIVFGGLAALGVVTGTLMTDQNAEAQYWHGGWQGHHHHHGWQGHHGHRHHGWYGHHGHHHHGWYGHRPYSYGYSYPSYRTYYYSSPGWYGYGHGRGHWDDDDD